MRIVPLTFDPPRKAVLNGINFHVLSPLYADLDFAAVSASAHTIRHLFGPENGWPDPGISFEDNKVDLERHEREFNEKSAFAYALLDPAGQKYLGCLYLEPIKSTTEGDRRQEYFKAQAFIWVSSLHPESNVSPLIVAATAWFKQSWSLETVAWPGRVQSWQEWKALSEDPIKL